MHLLKHKLPKQAPLVPIVSIFAVPGARKMRGRRYRDGVDIGPCGPPKPVPDVSAQKAVREAYEKAAMMPRPEEGGGFDLSTYHPLPGRMLVSRGPWIKSVKGIDLPEAQWRHEQYYFVIRVGRGVKNCAVGDRVIFQAKHKPKAVKLGSAGFYIARDAVVVGIVEMPEPV